MRVILDYYLTIKGGGIHVERAKLLIEAGADVGAALKEWEGEFEMNVNNRFYLVEKVPMHIPYHEGARYEVMKYDWDSARKKANAGNLKVFFVNIGYYIHVDEVPQEFLNLSDYCMVKYETSVNYTIAGQFLTSELAWLAHKRLFNWDMYVYLLPYGNWHHAREVLQTRKILENYFPLESGDTGPAGGLVIWSNRKPYDTEIKKNGYRCTEAAPFDVGWTTWRDAGQLCDEYSLNGITGWRLPTVSELKSFASVLRRRLRDEGVQQTTQTVFNWSDSQKGENAVAVVTQENENYYQGAYYYPMGGVSSGHYKSLNGPWQGHQEEFPVTHYYPVRPVRDFYVKNIYTEI
jgi:hypothetical protein